ncbi:hypothetical protein PG999_000632 [Apiospora kogelbergensis]|uniref:Uncharacterized protein n=1 Tax=Apiospora kogelbergensis TaxID=1337665 RepID=A0AAW0RCF8_9PEZI
MEAHAYFFKSPGRTKTPCIHHLGKPVAACDVGIYYRRLLPCLIPVSALYFTVPPDADEGMDIMANVKDPKAVPHRNIGWQCGLERGRANGAVGLLHGWESYIQARNPMACPLRRGNHTSRPSPGWAASPSPAPLKIATIKRWAISELHTAPSKMPDSGDQTSGSGGSSPADSTGSQEETQRGRSRTGYN